MLEKEIELRCVNLAKSLGVIGIKLNAVSNRGYPDRLFFIGNGVCWFVEFKRIGEKPRKKQIEIIKYLNVNNYKVDVIDSFDDFRKKLRVLLIG